jgi:asparagine synthetase B (glutamine-hydrolysing)
MCGVADVYKFNSPITADDLSAVRRMIDAQVYRRPDGEGLYRSA